jgi:hypothetical protein
VTIGSDLNTRIRQFRSIAGQQGVDLDYTKTLNLFAELGSRWLEGSTESERENRRDVFSKYLDYRKLEDDIISDWKEFEEFRKWKAKARNKSS